MVFGLLAALCCGCAGTRLLQFKKATFPTADARNPVVRIVSIWQPAEGHGPDGLPTRGFAGQILFFTRTHANPVKVDGDVRIYLFEDAGSVEQQSKPIHQFDFSKDAWNVHLAESTVGTAYTVFVPYVRKHLYEARCSLRLRLTPVEGPVVYSEMASVVLTGPKGNAAPSSDPDSEPPANQSGYTDATEADQRSRLDEELAQKLDQVIARRSSGRTHSQPQEQSAPNGAGATEEAVIQQASAVAAEPRDDVVQSRLDRLEQLIGQLVETGPAPAERPRVIPAEWAPQPPALHAHSEPVSERGGIVHRYGGRHHGDQVFGHRAVRFGRQGHAAEPAQPVTHSRPERYPLDVGWSEPDTAAELPPQTVEQPVHPAAVDHRHEASGYQSDGYEGSGYQSDRLGPFEAHPFHQDVSPIERSASARYRLTPANGERRHW